MIIRPKNLPRLKINAKRFFRNWDKLTAITILLSVSGTVASIFGGIQGVTDWTYVVIILFLIFFLTVFCAKYYQLKYSDSKPRDAIRLIHDLAEEFRFQNGFDIDGGPNAELSVEELDTVISRYSGFAKKICEIALNSHEKIGFSFGKATIKVCYKKRLFTVAQFSSGKRADGINFEASIPSGDDPFWELLRNVCKTKSYERCLTNEVIKRQRGNKDLDPRPKFLALDYLKSKDESHELPILMRCLDSGDSTFSSSTDPVHLWNKIRESGKGCSLSVLITGNPNRMALQKPISDSANDEVTRKPIGFIELESDREGVLDFLGQIDVHLLALIADACFVPLQRMEPFLLKKIK